MSEKADIINHPQHYNFTDDPAYEPIKVIEAWGLGFCLGNVVKYIARAGRKDAATLIQDLKKARWYLDRFILKHEGKLSKDSPPAAPAKPAPTPILSKPARRPGRGSARRMPHNV